MMTNTNEIAATIAAATTEQLAAIRTALVQMRSGGGSFERAEMLDDAAEAVRVEIERRRSINSACVMAAFRKARASKSV